MKIKTLFIVLFLFSIFYGCNEIFENDLTTKQVILLAPYDSLKTIHANQMFKWEEVYGAEWYNIRIVTPDFVRTELFLLDSVTTQTSYSFKLEPGKYQWAVMAANYSSQTPYTIYTLTVDTNKVFANKRIELRKPENIYYNKKNFLFNWAKLDDADKYRFEVRIKDWNTGIVYYAKDVFEDTISLALTETNYYWGVNAYNNETNTYTVFSYKQLMVDITAPKIPNLTKPNDNDTIKENSVTLGWERGQNLGSPIYDSLFVSTDSEFKTVVLSREVNDTSFTIQPDKGTYYWRIQSFDKAGNFDIPSSYRKFTISY